MQPIYYIDFDAQACHVEVFVNGFPAVRSNSRFYSNHAAAINHYLVGHNNIVRIVAVPTEIDAASTVQAGAMKQVKLHGAIKQYKPGEISCPEGGEVLAKFNYDQKPGGEFHFDNQVHDFSHLLLHNEKIKDAGFIKDYALTLFKFSSDDNMEALSHEFLPKMNDYSTAYFLDQHTTFHQFRTFLVDEFFKYPAEKQHLLREEIYVKPYCDDRIFEVGLLPDDPLLARFSEEDHGDKEYQMSIYVALVDGKLKVVR